uniref:Uncharacterized protein n=1 Tax=viral metagenome TaxID=1070528 RepID=A0A6C0C9N0_9ZZZZ
MMIKYLIITIILFIIGWQIFGADLKRMKIMDVPYSVKCYFGEEGCEKGDIDGETICRGLFFFVIGLIIPDKYIYAIIFISLMLIIEPLLGYNPKFIINPLISITGYMLGSVLSK